MQKLFKPFEVISDYKPSGDQPQAIKELVKRINSKQQNIVLLGATGTGKSATTAWLIEQIQRPTLVLEPNKTLAAQLCQEFRDLLPNNKVEYFVSYYDYYQPEAYIPQTDTFIEKDSSINDEIERLRHSATVSLLTRRDTVVVSSVSCIYGLGTPAEYIEQMIQITVGDIVNQTTLLRKFIKMQYTRAANDFIRGTFRVNGDIVEIIPMYEQEAYRIEFFGDEIDSIYRINPISMEAIERIETTMIFPASHYVAGDERLKTAIKSIKEELSNSVASFKRRNKLVEAQRLEMRTNFDIEMLETIGSCKGIENYSRHFDLRTKGSPPNTLLDFFDDDFVLIIDESHVTVPQIGAMFEGDASRKRMLIDHGFRLPSAADNRPLKWDEFLQRIGQTVYLSATPGEYEMNKQKSESSKTPVELIIRPTGLLDPQISVRPINGQIADLLSEIKIRIERDERVLITTLTKKMAEDLTSYLQEKDLKVQYLHSDVDTLKRVQLLTDLRLGKFDILVGINLLREGLDLPEVSLVAILDADKQGFLRSTRSLIQTIGRAARNVNGEVIMYADKITPQMNEAITETNRRRGKQSEFNKKHNIVPQPLIKKVNSVRSALESVDEIIKRNDVSHKAKQNNSDELSSVEMYQNVEKTKLETIISDLSDQMRQAAAELNFEVAAALRDEVAAITKQLNSIKRLK